MATPGLTRAIRAVTDDLDADQTAFTHDDLDAFEARRGRGRPKRDLADVERAILTWLAQQTGPAAWPDLRQAIGGAHELFRAALNALVTRGAVIRTGHNSTIRIGLPSVMEATVKANATNHFRALSTRSLRPWPARAFETEY